MKKLYKRCARCDKLIDNRQFKLSVRSSTFGYICNACVKSRRLQERFNGGVQKEDELSKTFIVNNSNTYFITS